MHPVQLKRRRRLPGPHRVVPVLRLGMEQHRDCDWSTGHAGAQADSGSHADRQDAQTMCSLLNPVRRIGSLATDRSSTRASLSSRLSISLPAPACSMSPRLRACSTRSSWAPTPRSRLRHRRSTYVVALSARLTPAVPLCCRRGLRPRDWLSLTVQIIPVATADAMVSDFCAHGIKSLVVRLPPTPLR